MNGRICHDAADHRGIDQKGGHQPTPRIGLILCRGIATNEEAPNEAASYGRTYRLYHCARANYVSVGYARSNTLGARRIIR
jgi:hypothetical protein